MYNRRKFLMQTCGGVGGLALTRLLHAEGLLGAAPGAGGLPRTHHPPKAKNCIYIYLEGGPSQMDLYDPKPMLNQLDGQALPESMLRNMRFAFLSKESARIMGTPRTFKPYGQCGMELSDLIPHIGSIADDICLVRSMHTDQFNHVPGQLLMNTGSAISGRPSIGSWLNYGLGSLSKNLPEFVVLITVGRGVPGGSASWSSGFLPSKHSGVMFRNDGAPVLNLENPAGITPEMQGRSIEAVAQMNALRHAEVRDPEIESRIAAYELAFRMQTAAPELMDLSGESKETLELYGVNRQEPKFEGRSLGGTGLFRTFAKNCLMARRLVERGVRVVNVIHASWDHHSRINEELPHNCAMADQPIAALVKDLKQRGLLEDTMVICGSEFGRTALGENRPGFQVVTGRDHHPNAFSIWLAGGGIKGGQVVGATDDIAWNVTQDPVHVHDLHATILHLFGFDHTRLTYRFQGRDYRLTDVSGHVVNKLYT
ncbi:MAG: DUF1501 domain-containing protein [Opitutus sp.]|nr:DUF1501 domain-containing protein [Opitutus sp.]